MARTPRSTRHSTDEAGGRDGRPIPCAPSSALDGRSARSSSGAATVDVRDPGILGHAAMACRPRHPDFTHRRGACDAAYLLKLSCGDELLEAVVEFASPSSVASGGYAEEKFSSSGQGRRAAAADRRRAVTARCSVVDGPRAVDPDRPPRDRTPGRASAGSPPQPPLAPLVQRVHDRVAAAARDQCRG